MTIAAFLESPAGRQSKLIAKSFVKVFAAVILAGFLADGADLFAVSLEDVRVWLAAAVAAALPIVLTAIDPADPRWGVGA